MTMTPSLKENWNSALVKQSEVWYLYRKWLYPEIKVTLPIEPKTVGSRLVHYSALETILIYFLYYFLVFFEGWLSNIASSETPYKKDIDPRQCHKNSIFKANIHSFIMLSVIISQDIICDGWFLSLWYFSF